MSIFKETPEKRKDYKIRTEVIDVITKHGEGYHYYYLQIKPLKVLMQNNKLMT